jgi:NifU-like protein
LDLRTIPEMTNAIKAGGACMSCHHVPGGLQDLLNDPWGTAEAKLPILNQTLPLGTPPAPAADKSEAQLSPFQFSKKVEKALEQYVRPMLQGDGGNVELLDIKDTLVYCRLTGACEGCAGSSQTLRMLVEQTLKEMVDQRIRVIGV